MLKEEVIIESININDKDVMEIKKAFYIYKNDVLVAKYYERDSLSVDDDTTGKDDKIIKIANALKKGKPK